MVAIINAMVDVEETVLPVIIIVDQDVPIHAMVVVLDHARDHVVGGVLPAEVVLEAVQEAAVVVQVLVLVNATPLAQPKRRRN